MIRISGPDAIKFFEESDLGAMELLEGAEEQMFEAEVSEDLDGDFEELKSEFKADKYMEPKYPINVDGKVYPKFRKDERNKSALLAVEPADVKEL